MGLKCANWTREPSSLVVRASALASRYRVFGMLSSVTGPSVSSFSSDIGAVSVFGAPYLSQSFTGHFFSVSIPEHAYRAHVTGESTSGSTLQTLLSEPTGFTAALPLPVSAYKSRPLSRRQLRDESAIDVLLQYLQPHGVSGGILAGFHPQGHDDVATASIFRNEPDVNVTTFYRWVVCGYELRAEPGDSPPRGWVLGMQSEAGFTAGLNYRHLMSQDPRARFVPLLAPDERVTRAARFFYDSQFPQLLPEPSSYREPVEVLGTSGVAARGTNVQFEHPNVLRIYRAGYASSTRIEALLAFMRQVPPNVAKGARLVREYGGRFPTTIGGWSKMDDEFQALRLEFYL